MRSRGPRKPVIDRDSAACLDCGYMVYRLRDRGAAWFHYDESRADHPAKGPQLEPIWGPENVTIRMADLHRVDTTNGGPVDAPWPADAVALLAEIRLDLLAKGYVLVTANYFTARAVGVEQSFAAMQRGIIYGWRGTGGRGSVGKRLLPDDGVGGMGRRLEFDETTEHLRDKS